MILYNCNSWAVDKKSLHTLDVCQRKHLRQIVNMHWPKSTISNTALYKFCNVTPLSERVRQSRWRMLGQVLRSDDLNPAQLVLEFAVNSSNIYKGRIGRHQTNLLRVIRSDLKTRNLKLDDSNDLHNLKHLARDRKCWKKLE